MLRAASKTPPLKLVWSVDFNVGNDHGEYLFVHIDSRDLVTHTFLLAGAESVHEAS